MSVSTKIAELIASRTPTTTDRIRGVWEEITVMRAGRLTYREIVAILKSEHDIVIKPDTPGKENTAAVHLATIIKRIQKQQEAKGGVRQKALPGTTAPDPIQAARKRYEDGRRPLFGSKVRIESKEGH